MVPVAAARMASRFDTPGLVSGSKRTSPSVSVTARRILRLTSSGSSSRYTVPWGDSDVLPIFPVGFCRSMMRAPTLGMAASGTTNVSP